MNADKLPKWSRYFLGFILYWITILLLPFALTLFNNLTPYSMEPGTITYLLFTLAVQPVSCFAACYVCRWISPPDKLWIVLINSMLAGAVMIVLLFFAYINRMPWEHYVSDVASLAVLVGAPAYFYKNGNPRAAHAASAIEEKPD